MPVYMNYEGITGTGTGKYNGWIVLESCQLGKNNANTSNNSSSRKSEQIVVQDVVVSKLMDNTSARLSLESVRGEGKKVIIDFVAGGESVPYLSIELENVIISSYSIGGHSGGSAIPMESLSLNFTKISYISKPTAPAKDPKHVQEKATWNFAVQNSRYS